jgi:hypothetical protein
MFKYIKESSLLGKDRIKAASRIQEAALRGYVPSDADLGGLPDLIGATSGTSRSNAASKAKKEVQPGVNMSSQKRITKMRL